MANSRTTKIVAGFLVILCASMLYGVLKGDPTQSAPTDPLSDQAVAIVRSIKNSMREPDSFKLEYALYPAQNGNPLCIGYSARNGFGGVNREVALYFEGEIFTSDDRTSICRLVISMPGTRSVTDYVAKRI